MSIYIRRLHAHERTPVRLPEVNLVTTKFAVRSIARRYQRLSEKIFELDEAIESAGGRSRAGIGRRRGH